MKSWRKLAGTVPTRDAASSGRPRSILLGTGLRGYSLDPVDHRPPACDCTGDDDGQRASGTSQMADQDSERENAHGGTFLAKRNVAFLPPGPDATGQRAHGFDQGLLFGLLSREFSGGAEEPLYAPFQDLALGDHLVASRPSFSRIGRLLPQPVDLIVEQKHQSRRGHVDRDAVIEHRPADGRLSRIGT